MLSLVDALETQGWVAPTSELSVGAFGDGVQRERVARAELLDWLRDVDDRGQSAHLRLFPNDDDDDRSVDFEIARRNIAEVHVAWYQKVD